MLVIVDDKMELYEAVGDLHRMCLRVFDMSLRRKRLELHEARDLLVEWD